MSLFEVVEFEGGSGSYSMTLNSAGSPVLCSCPGFTYRKHCRHIDNPSEWLPETQEAQPKMPSKKNTRDRLTRDQAQPMVDEIESRLKALDLDYEIGGSWRRGSPTVADLDVVIFGAAADSFDLGLEMSRSGPKVASGDLVMPDGAVLQVDLWGEVTVEQRGAFMWFVTGPKELNIAMRSAASRMGLTLSQYGLISAGDQQVDDGTEKGIADALGWPNIAPTDRDRWRDKK